MTIAMIVLGSLLFVLGLNILTYNGNRALWRSTEGLRVPNRRYTPREMRSLLEDARAAKLTNKGKL